MTESPKSHLSIPSYIDSQYLMDQAELSDDQALQWIDLTFLAGRRKIGELHRKSLIGNEIVFPHSRIP